jgi:hypothetical protein
VRRPISRPSPSTTGAGRHQVVALEGVGGILGRVARLEREAPGQHYAAHRQLEVGDDEPGERQRAFQPALAVDDEQLVGVVGQLVQPPEVARRGF